MTKWQLINILLVWLFFGLLGAYLAKKKGRNPLLWFSLGPILGIFGIILLFFLPRPVRKKKSQHIQPIKVLPPASFHEAWTKFWYYLDKGNCQQGPIEFPELAKSLEKKEISENSYIWGEGMSEWKRLGDMPDIQKEMQRNSRPVQNAQK